MGNKILMAFVAADILFLISGAIQLGFSIIVQNTMNNVANDGETLARNLLYQRFPLQGTSENIRVVEWLRERPSKERRTDFNPQPASSTASSSSSPSSSPSQAS
jgi:hypothetical protein